MDKLQGPNAMPGTKLGVAQMQDKCLIPLSYGSGPRLYFLTLHLRKEFPEDGKQLKGLTCIPCMWEPSV